jgi:hypothetical protein
VIERTLSRASAGDEDALPVGVSLSLWGGIKSRWLARHAWLCGSPRWRPLVVIEECYCRTVEAGVAAELGFDQPG